MLYKILLYKTFQEYVFFILFYLKLRSKIFSTGGPLELLAFCALLLTLGSTVFSLVVLANVFNGNPPAATRNLKYGHVVHVQFEFGNVDCFKLLHTLKVSN